MKKLIILILLLPIIAAAQYKLPTLENPIIDPPLSISSFTMIDAIKHCYCKGSFALPEFDSIQIYIVGGYKDSPIVIREGIQYRQRYYYNDPEVIMDLSYTLSWKNLDCLFEGQVPIEPGFIIINTIPKTK